MYMNVAPLQCISLVSFRSHGSERLITCQNRRRRQKSIIGQRISTESWTLCIGHFGDHPHIRIAAYSDFVEKGFQNVYVLQGMPITTRFQSPH